MEFFGCLSGAVRRKLKHCIEKDSFANRTQSSCSKLKLCCFINDKIEYAFIYCQCDAFHVEKLFILLEQCIFWFSKDRTQGTFIKRVEMGNDRKSSYQFG